MNRLKKIPGQPWFAYTVATCSAVLLYVILSQFNVVTSFFSSIMGFLSPVILGAVFAYLMNPIACFFEKLLNKRIGKEGLSHTLSVILAVIIALLAVVLIIVSVVPSVVSNVVTLAANSDSYIKTLDKYFSFSEIVSQYNINFDQVIQHLEGALKNLLKIIPSSIGTILKTSVSVGSGVASVAIDFIIAIYFLLDKKRILGAIDRFRRALLSEKNYLRDTDFLKHCDKVFIQYLGCNLLDGLIVGGANAVFMLILGMPYVALLSVLVGVTNLLPTFGPIIGAVIGAFILVINKPVMALWFLIFTIVLQTLDGYVIKPKLFGASLGIPDVLTLVSIILGGKLCGIIGIFLAIPVTCVICDIYATNFLPWLEKKRGIQN